MTPLLKILLKYIIILIISSILNTFSFFSFTFYRELLGFDNLDIIQSIPTYIDYLVRILIVILLAIDIKREKIKFVWLICIAGFFYSLLGILIFALMYLEKKQKEVSA